MFPIGLIIMLTDFGRQFAWTTTIFLGIQGVILFLIAVKSAGLIKALVSALLILLLSFFIEYVGLKTGFPFGKYTYTDVLSPLVSGIPIAITFAWFSVTVSSYLLTLNLYSKAGIFSASFISSVLVLSVDILLEPFASFINGFWLWDAGTIPFQNYVSWLVLGFLFCLIISIFVNPGLMREMRPGVKNIPYLVFAVNMLTFLVINIINGYIFLSLIAMLIIVMLTLILPGSVKYET